jgi:hypothetical protein
MKLLLGLTTALLLGMAFLTADEPAWTPAQRQMERDAVITGRVVRLTTLQRIDKYSDWAAAEIEVAAVVKPHAGLKGATLTVYFESARGNNARCPDFAAPKMGERADFYLRFRPAQTARKEFVIEMNSDIIRPG